ncbi:MAG: hypothetical protein H7Z14_02175 [Anaerolineae bacterium]|nr:hypothetical protein [Phycisphaerae bacterium]
MSVSGQTSKHLSSWRAVPFFVPGWLYIPILWFGMSLLPKSINENVLSLIVQIPVLASLLVLIPLRKGWTTWQQVWIWVVLPNLVVGFALMLSTSD